MIKLAPSFAILLPAYNVDKHIADVVRQLLSQYPGCCIVVVDDGSLDQTSEIVADQFPKVALLSHKRNLGKGAALRTGIDFVLEHCDADAIAFLDADGQHAPGDLEALLNAFDRQQGDFIIGKRQFRIGHMPLHRILSNKLSSALVALKIKRHVSDTQSGFRVISTRVLKKILPIRADGYDFETEVLLKAAKAGAQIAEIPIQTLYRGERSHIRAIRDIARFLKSFFTS